MTSNVELPEILRDMAAGRRNSVGDYWSRDYCDKAAAKIEALAAEVRTLVRQNGEWQARVKPAEPRRIWVNIREDVMSRVYTSREQADLYLNRYGRTECVEFVEVVK